MRIKLASNSTTKRRRLEKLDRGKWTEMRITQLMGKKGRLILRNNHSEVSFPCILVKGEWDSKVLPFNRDIVENLIRRCKYEL